MVFEVGVYLDELLDEGFDDVGAVWVLEHDVIGVEELEGGVDLVLLVLVTLGVEQVEMVMVMVIVLFVDVELVECVVLLLDLVGQWV